MEDAKTLILKKLLIPSMLAIESCGGKRLGSCGEVPGSQDRTQTILRLFGVESVATPARAPHAVAESTSNTWLTCICKERAPRVGVGMVHLAEGSEATSYS